MPTLISLPDALRGQLSAADEATTATSRPDKSDRCPVTLGTIELERLSATPALPRAQAA